MPTTIVIDGVTLTLKKYPEFPAGSPTATDITLFATPVAGDLFKTTMDNFIANVLNVDGVTITGDGSSGNPLIANSIVSANNGLHIDGGSGDVYLGGTLQEDTTINQVAKLLNFTSNQATSAITSTNIGAGYAFSGIAASGLGVYGQATSGTGLYGQNDNGIAAVIGYSASSQAGQFESNPASTNTVHNVFEILRSTQGAAADGIGGALKFTIETDNGSDQLSNQIISKWSTAANAARTSQFVITGVDSAVTQDEVTINGSGSLQLNQYGSGSFTGTPAFTLQVDASGNIIEGSVGGADGNFFTPDQTSAGTTSHNLNGNPFNVNDGANGYLALDPTTTNSTIRASDGTGYGYLSITGTTAAASFAIVISSGAGGMGISGSIITGFIDINPGAGDTRIGDIGGVGNSTLMQISDVDKRVYVQSEAMQFTTPISATEAATHAFNGMIVYVNSTDGTFTSIGFWGFENGAWHKF